MHSEGLRIERVRLRVKFWGSGGGGVINLFKSEEQAGLSRAALEIYSVIS